jgi:hypothetical protein
MIAVQLRTCQLKVVARRSAPNMKPAGSIAARPVDAPAARFTGLDVAPDPAVLIWWCDHSGQMRAIRTTLRMGND